MPITPLGDIAITERGFELIEFKDNYREPCSLQQSSMAVFEQPGTSAVWLGCSDAKNERRMHLDFEQVKALVAVLTSWINNGSFAEPPGPADEGTKV